MYSAMWSVGECNPAVRRQSDGKLQVYPTGLTGTLLIVTEQEWQHLAQAVAVYLEHDAALDRGKPLCAGSHQRLHDE